MKKERYYEKRINDVFNELKTGRKGLSEKKAKARLEKYGLNRIKEEKRISRFSIFLNQFKSFVVIVLIIATAISFFIGEIIDAVVILVIVIFNAVFGFIQEYNVEKSIEALKKLTALKTIVIRDGKEKEIDAKEVVVGDIIVLGTGTKIPADARLIEAANLGVQEASLTGESIPVAKDTSALKGHLSVGDQKNMVFSSTIVTRGEGKAVVVRTGMKSEVGKIAKMIQETKEEQTPLQIKLDILGKRLGILTIVICLVIFVLEIYAMLPSAQPLFSIVHDAFMVAVALAVAAIPEGLPAVVTISLALGVRRMIKRNALIRKMASVETLGSTDIICSDKTGTLTKNEMTVKKIFCNNKIVEATGSGYEPKGRFIYSKKAFNPAEFDLLFRISVLCNNAELVEDMENWKIIGDPTEGSLLVSARKAKVIQSELNSLYPRVGQIPFSSERKLMTTINKIGKGKVAYVKGAPEVVLELCSRIYDNGKIKPLTSKAKKRILHINDKFANEALRVLGFAYKPVKGKNVEKDMIFVGLQGIIDPPRSEVKDSILKCRDAGIKVLMITGDHKNTAAAVAKELGIKGNAITGSELDTLTDKEFKKRISKISIYARVNPEHKIKIVNALKEKGHVVAMTGDGVNDAPALKKADIGVAMGITGTDVAKEASDMVLTDDNFTSIINAVEEGRGIYNNIKKFVNYLLSSNMGEILVILTASLLGMPLPLTAIQLLWLNLVTDGLPAIALGVDPTGKDIMKQKPRDPKENIMNKEMITSIVFVGILIAAASLYLFKINLSVLIKAQTIAFTSLVVFEIVRLQVIRSNYKTGIFSNKYLILAVLSSIGLQLIVIYTPLNVFFKVVPLSILDWVYILAASTSLIVLNWFLKIVFRFTNYQSSS